MTNDIDDGERKMATVRVRIAAAVNPDGEWNACGWSGTASDDDKMSLCVDPLAAGEKRYWLEAELEIPSVDTVQASVSTA